jgi:F420-dependent oxidoreductase-like protein
MAPPCGRDRITPTLGTPTTVLESPAAMRFGIHNPSWVFGPDPADAFEAVKAKAQWAEDHGFAWFSVMDHTIQIPRVGAPDEPVLEGWVVLAALAAVTRRIRLATLATAVGYRNPAHLAKIAASVDVISRGRLTLGIGAGFFEDEYRQYGWPFPPAPATRIAQMEEAVRLIVKMWTERRTTFHGRYFHVEDAILEPKPVQTPRPPVMIAGGGEQLTLRAVARLADACNLVGGDPAEVTHKLDVLRRHCDAAGRDYDTIEKTHVQPWHVVRDARAVMAKREWRSAHGASGGFVGTASEAIDVIGQYQRAGVDLLITSDRTNDVESRELFASEVMPHFS